MGERYWLWVGARLLVALAIVAWAASYLTTGSGEKEFQKTLDAMKQVHSFRVAYSASLGTQHDELLWEVDCDKDILHHQWHQSGSNGPTEMSRDEIEIATKYYVRGQDGSWTNHYATQGTSAKWYCSQIAQGIDSNLLPQIATMIRRGIIQKGDNKTVNGVRCREWLVTMKGGFQGLEHDTVCLGREDHLPYEMTVDWQHSRSSFSDYNTPLRLDLPAAAVQPASTTIGSN
jgi:hypothetical protein